MAVLLGRLAEGARPRQGRAERIQGRDRLPGPRRGGRSQAARYHAAPEARGDQPGRRPARARDAVGDLARRRHRGEGAADDGADLYRYRTLRRVAGGGAGPRPGCSRIRKFRGQAQDAAAALFAQIYLSPKGDDLPPVDALGMFYEYQRIDADRAARRRDDPQARGPAGRGRSARSGRELLQYQVDKRLEGAARAQVAARLAMVYLTNRKPDRAISALRTTRIADLSGELRQQRLLLECARPERRRTP